MKVLKFGGSSVGDATNISQVIQIIYKSLEDDADLVIVVSALGGVTDNLIRVATLASAQDEEYKQLLRSLTTQHDEVIRKLIDKAAQSSALRAVETRYTELQNSLSGVYLLGELSPRTLDKISSFGEQLSAYIISEATKATNINCRFVDSRTLIKTDSNFGAANVDVKKTYDLLADHFKSHRGISVLGGYIASDPDGTTTTLGRGGSDYTAALVGAALKAETIEIWTDVDGVLTADPRKVKDAFPVSQISYEEAGELAHFGAKVIHPKTMRPARLKNIPIDIKNTFNPAAAGTRISNEPSGRDYLIKGISSLGNVALLRMQSNNGKNIGEVAAKLFDALSRYEIEVFLTTQASYEQAISIAVSSGQAIRAKAAIEKAFALELRAKEMSPVFTEDDLSIVAIVGKLMKGVPGITGKFFGALGMNNINVVAIAQGSSELNISAVISASDEPKALQVIHQEFFNSKDGSHARIS